jgi:(R,R)-butanediol dehydrogenase / meso-butanediol dehydrogenase / diacetyl reductase
VKAAVIGADRTVTVADIQHPVPAADEAVIDVRYCGICGSDLHMLSMPAHLVPPGHVLGHEFTGVVSALGPGVTTGWSVGDRVVVLPMVACGQCYACRAGHSNLCEKGGIDDGPGIGRPGGYAESVAVPAGMLRRLPPTVSDSDGALAEPLAVALRAIRLSGVTPDEPTCVLGAGPIGVLAVAGLLAEGFERVAVVEPAPRRRAAAERLGVRAVGPEEAAAEIPGLLGGERPAVVIDSTGHPSGAPLALRLLPAGGRLTVVGLPDAPVPLDLGLLAFKEITVRGSLVYDEHDFAAAVAHIAAGHIPCDRIITKIAPLDSASDMVAELRSGTTEHVKILLTP